MRRFYCRVRRRKYSHVDADYSSQHQEGVPMNNQPDNVVPILLRHMDEKLNL